jgi:hypothetical protein
LESLEDAVKSVMQTNALFTFWTQCYSCKIWLDIYYTEFLTLFWFAMLANEYRLEIQFKKVWKVRNINNIPMVGSRPLEYRRHRTYAQNRLHSIFNYFTASLITRSESDLVKCQFLNFYFIICQLSVNIFFQL